jgi:hypothetical protein
LPCGRKAMSSSTLMSASDVGGVPGVSLMASLCPSGAR